MAKSNKLSSAMTSSKIKWSGPKVWLATLIALLVGGGIAAGYSMITQDTSPEAIWRRSLETTSKGLERYVASIESDDYIGGTIDGYISMSSPVAVDGRVSGRWYESNIQLDTDVGVSGLRATGEIKAIAPEADTPPDAYFRLSGLERLGGLLSQLGAEPEVSELLQEVNNTWYVADHTLLEQAMMTGNGSVDKLPGAALSPEDYATIGERSAKVLDERLFTDDPEKAVVVIDEYIGEEVFEDSNTYKYRVKIQKQQLKEFTEAMADALEDTKFKDIVLGMSNGEAEYRDALKLDTLLKKIDKLDIEDATAEAWVDKKDGFIRNIRLTTEQRNAEQGAFIDVGLHYVDGDDLPFYVRLVNEKEGILELGLTYNQQAASVKLTFDYTAETMDGSRYEADGELTITGSDDVVMVEKPEKAKNILELLATFEDEFGSDVPMDDRLNNIFPVDDVEL